MVKFISYDGHYPNLCSGTLVFEVNGKKFSLQDCLQSNGSCDWMSEETTQRPWTVVIPPELAQYAVEISNMVNANIPWGCCGGCI